MILKHNVWREKRAHCIAYNKICTKIFVQQIIVQIILLILSDICSKRSNLTTLQPLLPVDVFSEVAEVNADALNIKPYQPRQNIAEEVPRQNVFSYSYIGKKCWNSRVETLLIFSPLFPLNLLCFFL